MLNAVSSTHSHLLPRLDGCSGIPERRTDALPAHGVRAQGSLSARLPRCVPYFGCAAADAIIVWCRAHVLVGDLVLAAVGSRVLQPGGAKAWPSCCR